ADTPYETKAALLPKSLREAVFALQDDAFFRQALGDQFVDYYVHIKNAEIERFQAEVSDWEHREYFEMFLALPACKKAEGRCHRAGRRSRRTYQPTSCMLRHRVDDLAC